MTIARIPRARAAKHALLVPRPPGDHRQRRGRRVLVDDRVAADPVHPRAAGVDERVIASAATRSSTSRILASRATPSGGADAGGDGSSRRVRARPTRSRRANRASRAPTCAPSRARSAAAASLRASRRDVMAARDAARRRSRGRCSRSPPVTKIRINFLRRRAAAPRA